MKTLAERAEEARIILVAQNKVKREEREFEEAKGAIEYFKVHLPEAQYIGGGKFDFDGKLFDWHYKSPPTEIAEYQLGDFKFGKFSNLGEYGAYLKRKKEYEVIMESLKPERPHNRIETEEGAFEPIFQLFKTLFCRDK